MVPEKHLDAFDGAPRRTIASSLPSQLAIHEPRASKLTTPAAMSRRRSRSATKYFELSAFRRLMLSGAAVVMGGSFHFGYQISLINPLADVLQNFIRAGLKQSNDSRWDENAASLLAEESALHDALWACVAGILFAGALFGALIAPLFLENIGAKRSLLISSLILCASFSLAAAAKFIDSPLTFICARFLSGIGIGLVTTVQTVYLTEISPVKHRGLMGTLTGFSTSIGFFVASGLGTPQLLGTESSWPFAYVIEVIPSVLLLIILLAILEESPVYSMRRGRVDDALRCIRLYHASVVEQEARLVEVHAESGRFCAPASNDSQRGANSKSDHPPHPQSVSLANLLSTKSSRNALLICVLLNATVSFSGIMAVSFFGTFLLHEIGFDENSAAVANCVASFSGILGNVAGSFAIDKIGRRVLIIAGLCTLAVLNTALMCLDFAFQYTGVVSLGYGFLVVFMFFLFAFSCGVGPMAWFLATELSVGGARPRVQSASVACQYATCFLSPLLFFPLYRNFGAASFLLFILPLILTALYLTANLPETRNRSIQRIVADLDGGSGDGGSGNGNHSGGNNAVSAATLNPNSKADEKWANILLQNVTSI